MRSESIQWLSERLERMQEEMNNFKLNKDCETIYFLGVTGSGKSSSINYFLNKGPLPQKHYRGNYQIESLENGPAIGHTNTSCTEIPAIYKDPSENKVYIDPPGFMDTKGPMQETINGLCNALMFDRGVQTKIILVIELNTIQSGKGGDIPEIAKRLFDLFGKDFNQLMNSIMILVTKVNINDISISDIIENLRSIAVENKNMIGLLGPMISCIIQNDNVALLPNPIQVKQETVTNILLSVNKMIPTTLKYQTNVSLSYQAREMLQDLNDEITHQFNTCIKEFKSQIEERYCFKTYSSTEACEKAIGELKIGLDSLKNSKQQDWAGNFLYFMQQTKMDSSMINKFIANTDQIKLFHKFRLPIKINMELVQAIPACLEGVLRNLQGEMHKLMTKEQLKVMNARHEQALKQHSEKIEKIMQQAQQASKADKEKTGDRMRREREHFKKIIQNSQMKYRGQMTALNDKIEQMQRKTDSEDSGVSIFGEILQVVKEIWLAK